MPIFELFFAANGPLHVAKHLKMNEAVNGILRRMTGHRAVAMLPNASNQVRGHANIDRAVKLVRKDVDARVFLFSHQRNLAAKWTLKQVQGDGFFALCVSPQVQRQKPRYAPPHQPSTPRHPELVSGSIGRFTHFVRLVLTEAAW